MAWNENLNIELPKTWIDPSEVTPLLPPYYQGVVESYIDWMRQPHASLSGLSWGDTLDYIHRPLNPAVKEAEEKDPTTYFIYEAMYTFFAGLVTEELKPQTGLTQERENHLKRNIIAHFAELMLSISELGTSKISFVQDYDYVQKTYRLASPKLYTHADRTNVATYTFKNPNSFQASFAPEDRMFSLIHNNIDMLHHIPGEINGQRTSYLATLRLDKARPQLDDRRLMLDVDIRKLHWDIRADGRCLPIPGAQESLMDEFFGAKKRHMCLAILIGNEPDQFDIDTITKTVVRELGLVPLLSINQATVLIPQQRLEATRI